MKKSTKKKVGKGRRIGRFFLIFLTILMPWVALFLNDNPGAALIALVMQVTVIGWPIASIWAVRTIFVKENQEDEEEEP
ncbi:MAG: hypothetical protein Q8R79_00410 [Legionellaceae bacterium]|nr:hypothetical protein [Legionellaceae bacterium]